MTLRQCAVSAWDLGGATLLDAAYAAIDAMVLVIDARTGMIRSANPAFCLTTGYRAGEICGQPLATLYDPQMPTQTRRRIDEILVSGGAGRIEIMARRRNGAGFSIDLALSPIAETPGPYYAAVLRDITRQRQELAEIAHAHDLIQAIAKGVPGVVYQYVIEADGRRYYSFISEGCRELFGIDAAELTSGSQDQILATVAPEARPALLRSVEDSRRSLGPWLHVFHSRSAAGGRWIRGSARPHRLADGSTVWNGMLIDITEQHEARTAAEAASKAKSEFMANISHELRTPLNAVIGFSQMLERDLTDPGQATYAAEIRRSGTALLELINSVLELSQIDAGRLVLAEAETDIAELVAPCLEVLRGRLIGRAVSLDNRLDRILPRLVVDRRQIRQALTHLLSNAVKFTPDGGLLILDAEVQGDGTMVLSVEDTGIGMAPDQIATVFEPFAQLDTGLNRRNTGVGLGLTLSRAIAEAHGGRIALASEPGLGTVARLILPAERVRQR
jgi:PAS domain S-box-containing protein